MSSGSCVLFGRQVVAGGCGLWTGWNNVVHYTVAEQQAFDGAQVMCKFAHVIFRPVDVQCVSLVLVCQYIGVDMTPIFGYFSRSSTTMQ